MGSVLRQPLPDLLKLICGRSLALCKAVESSISLSMSVRSLQLDCSHLGNEALDSCFQLTHPGVEAFCDFSNALLGQVQKAEWTDGWLRYHAKATGIGCPLWLRLARQAWGLVNWGGRPNEMVGGTPGRRLEERRARRR